MLFNSEYWQGCRHSNIVVKTNFRDTKWMYGYIWNSLSAKSYPEKMVWTTDANAICALYSDSFE